MFGAGAYVFYGYGLEHSIEADLAWARIKYNPFDYQFNGSTYRAASFRLDQTDLTLKYNNYSWQDFNFNVGLHAIFSDDAFTDGSYIVFGGIKRYRAQSYSAGINVYKGFYDNYQPSLNTTQADVYFGFYFGNYFKGNYFYTETKGSYINLSQEIGFNQKQLPSIEQNLYWYLNSTTINLKWWSGYRVFAVEKGGFVLFNLAEKHIGGLGASVKFGLGKNSSLEVKAERRLFKELGRGAVSQSLSGTVVYGITL